MDALCRKKVLSPELLVDQLRLQARMGVIGEQIALEYERERLTKLGITDVASCIDHVSLYNTTAGYDLVSIANNEQRFIEVKASFSVDSNFYLSNNELEVLEAQGNSAYLYCVLIDDLASASGQVARIIKNPIKVLKSRALIEPVLYRITDDYE